MQKKCCGCPCKDFDDIHRNRSPIRVKKPEMPTRRSYSSSAVRLRNDQDNNGQSCSCYVRKNKPILICTPRDSPTTCTRSPKVSFTKTDLERSPERNARDKSSNYYPYRMAS